LKLFDNILHKLGIRKPEEVQQEAVRIFKAAQVSRLTNDWASTSAQIDQDLRSGNKVLRSRAKDLVKNNDYAKAIITQFENNVIGPHGIKLQVRAKNENGTYDKFANDLIERKWKQWCRAEYCTMSGTLNFNELLTQLYSTLIREGEFIVRKVITTTKANPFGFSLEVIDPIDLDDDYTEELKNGNFVIMGVELNQWRKPVAYHFKKSSLRDSVAGYYYTYGSERYRVPADQIIHVYKKEFVKQTRGYTHFAQSLLRLKMIEGYEDASLTKARASAGVMGFFEQPVPEGQKYQGDTTDEDNNQVLNMQPGTMINLGYGQKFTGFDPDFPHEQFDPFIKANLRAVCAAFGIDPGLTFKDIIGATYSSLKAGRSDAHDTYVKEQNRLIERTCLPVFESWLERGLMGGAIALPITKFDKFNAPHFIGRKWKLLEPVKEVKADKMRKEEGWVSDTEIISESGRDPEDVFNQIAADKELKKNLGLSETPKAIAPEDDNTDETGDEIQNEQNKTIYKIG
jgi:lambda family phage portal protein